MNKIAALALVMLLLCPTLSFAQSLQSEGSSVVDKSKVIVTLLKRVDDLEALKASYEQREKTLQEQIAKAEASRQELTTAYKESLLELGAVRQAMKDKDVEISALKEQVALWKSETQRVNQELSASRKRETILLVGHILRSIIGR